MNNQEIKLSSDAFKHVGKNLEAAQQIKRPSMSYFQDSMRRLKNNKVAILSFWILIVMFLLSILGPTVAFYANGHTYENQNLSEANQTMIMGNARSITLKANDVISYKKYKPNGRKNEVVFTNVGLKAVGKIAFQIGNKAEEGWQGDKKEYQLEVSIVSTDNWNSILDKLNSEGQKLLQRDPDFRGITFAKKGGNLVIQSQGERWFNSKHWLGTDEFGRDLFTRLWKGGQLSFLIAFVSVFVTSFFGIIYGGISGYFGGIVDTIMMRIIEILMTVPDMLYVILLLTVLKPGVGPIMIVLIATGWLSIARVVRGEVMRLKHAEYVVAAEALGADSKRIILKHLIPNTMGPILVNMTMRIPGMIFAEAFLSFIGLGVQPPYASWGSLANAGARIFMQHPNQLIVPGIAISITMLAFNLLGDGLRDALDPKLRK